jgi:hypothetical protein
VPGVDEEDIENCTAAVNSVEVIEDLRQALLGR